jgi:hypothetical protein
MTHVPRNKRSIFFVGSNQYLVVRNGIFVTEGPRRMEIAQRGQHNAYAHGILYTR